MKVRNSFSVAAAAAAVTFLGAIGRPSSDELLARAPSAAGGEIIAGGQFDASGPRYSPDGTHIAFTIRRGGKPDIAIVGANGGASRIVTTTGTNIHPAWSPDGKRLAYIAHEAGKADLHTIDADGSDRVRITQSGASMAAPDWSPDGHTIVYSSNAGGDWNIWAVPAAGGTARKLTTHPGDEWNPRYSPDGRFILFSTNWGENANIDAWMIPAAGGELHRLTSGLEDEVTPAWSPDGRHLAFLTDLGGLWVMDLVSGERRNIAPGEGFQDILSWSPDGRRIAVALNAEPFRLFEISLEGGDSRPGGLLEWNVWTPDVSRISGAVAFSTLDRTGNGDVWIVSDPATEPKRLTSDPAPDLHPAWSPAGDRIAFVSRRDGAHNGDIWVSLGIRGPETRLTWLRSAHRPRWCADNRILFHSDRSDDGQPHIWAVSPGAPPRQLTNGPRETEPECVPATGDVLYVGSIGRGSELFRMRFGGGDAIRLTSDGAAVRFPRASPDGSRVAFVSNRDGPWEIFVMPIGGGTARRVTNDGGQKSPPAWSPDGSSLIYSVKHGESQIRAYRIPQWPKRSMPPDVLPGPFKR